MQVITAYKSVDGQIFEDEGACIAHERTLASKEPLSELPINELGLTLRTVLALTEGGILTVGQLMKATDDELLGGKFPSFSRKQLKEVTDALAARDLALSSRGRS
ncbi:hypothetical protein KTD31_00950 [Burkholderia multivorans]|uniref:DNA-directed RNA polymerase subunit alpha C-terminal domain-containing protein n=1 Tax=Burkholderia multivorans TaxID=87883 RepID=UPI001C240407|nr:DNA-directed RNA polymerase subunit alpha C-terminal domain-containing protein [Burkholderia multivorans]MBU9199969.1 hypothetical protein [Burkholderia multivorans]MDN8078912.1 DNA-directed RNA polymerase subunit alpha C-terminal domain-containing protein [Burkholderia multivorans]